MVQLHASRYEQAGSRPTEDIDILANSRQRPQSMTELIAERLVELGYEVAKRTGGITTPTTVFRFECDGEVVDVLAPDGLGDVPPRTLGTGETLQIPGGTQALHRTETVMVEVEGGRSGAMRCPSLSAALLLKARSIQTAHRDQDRQDLVVLLSCVDDPIAVRGQLKPSELRWLRRAAKRLRIDAPDLSDIFSGEQLARARAAYKLLSGT